MFRGGGSDHVLGLPSLAPGMTREGCGGVQGRNCWMSKSGPDVDYLTCNCNIFCLSSIGSFVCSCSRARSHDRLVDISLDFFRLGQDAFARSSNTNPSAAAFPPASLACTALVHRNLLDSRGRRSKERNPVVADCGGLFIRFGFNGEYRRPGVLDIKPPSFAPAALLVLCSPPSFLHAGHKGSHGSLPQAIEPDL